MLAFRIMLISFLVLLVACIALQPRAPGPLVISASAPVIKYPTPGVVMPDHAERFGFEDGIHVEVTGLQTSRAGLSGVGGIRGIAENRTGKKLTLCAITFQLLSDSGAVTATANAVTQHLEAGQRWEFQAAVFSPYQARFSEVRVGGISAVPARLP